MKANNLNLNLLEKKRREYCDIKWLSSKGRSTFITEMETSYITNCSRKCAEKLVVNKYLEWIEDINLYEGHTYEEWLQFFKNEVLYRRELEALRDSHMINKRAERDYEDEYEDGYDIDMYGFCD